MSLTMVFMSTLMGTSLLWCLAVLFITIRFQRVRSRLENDLAEKKTRLDMFEQGKNQWALEFNQIAEQIFSHHTEKSDKQLVELLKPLKSQLGDFSKQIQENYEKDLKEKSILATEIKHLQKLNQSMTVETINLTRALQGQNKMQGCWGELMLERALELSGLQPASEYELQVHLKDKSGQGFQPDAVVHLPGERDVVIDAKVTLTAYTRYINAETEEERHQALSQHIQSLKTHIKSLGQKNYSQLTGIQSLDVVFLFMPIEAALHCILQAEPDIYEYALASHIIVVTPMTLLATLRTVEQMWRMEKQNKHAQKIAEKAGNLYDKFAMFCQDLIDVGKRLEQTQKGYDAAMNKLTAGKGNLISRVSELKAIGVKNHKEIPELLQKEMETAES